MIFSYADREDRMDSKLDGFNRKLARVVFVAAGLFASVVTLLAAMTGETTLFAGTALGVAAGAYALAVVRKPSDEVVKVASHKQAVAA